MGRLYSTGTTQPLSARATVSQPYLDKARQARPQPERATLGSTVSPRRGTGQTPEQTQTPRRQEQAQARVLTTAPSPLLTVRKVDASPVPARRIFSADCGSSEVPSPVRTSCEAKQGSGTAHTATGTGNFKVLVASPSPVKSSGAQGDAQIRGGSHDRAVHMQRPRSLDRIVGEAGPEAVSTQTHPRDEILQTLRREMWTEYMAQSRIFEALQAEVRQELRNIKDTISAEVALRWDVEARVALEATQRLQVEAVVAKEAAQLREMGARLTEDIQRMELRLVQQTKFWLEEEMTARKAVDNHLEEQIGRIRSALQVEFDSCSVSHAGDPQHMEFAKQCEELWFSQLERHEVQRSSCGESPRHGLSKSPAAVPQLGPDQGKEGAAGCDLLRCGSKVALSCASKDAFVGEISVEAAVSIAGQAMPGQSLQQKSLPMASQEMARCPSAVLELRAAMQQHNQLSQAVTDLETRIKGANLH